MPEGDTLRRAAERLRALEGDVLAVEAPHPRAAALGIAERIDGRRLERVEAIGKNLLLYLEEGFVLRSHLRMRGRWRVQSAGSPVVGTPWLVLRGRELEAILWNGPVLELGRWRAGNVRPVRAGHARPVHGAGPRLRELGPDILEDPPDLEAMLARLRATAQTRELGEALLDQRLVAGIGNMWKAETLFHARASPWAPLAALSDDVLRTVLAQASALMRAGRRERFTYRRTGRPCRRCGARIHSAGQGETARTAYWCPRCQAGTERAKA